MHGRFQPLHNGHLEYILAALERCDYLFVGITQYRHRELVRVDVEDATHRAEPRNNPLTYFERDQVLRTVLRANGVAAERFSVLPFPIEHPAELSGFLATEVPIFTTTYDKWNEEKIRTLEEVGYQVINLWSRDEKAFVGRQIRSLMAANDPRWREQVPASAAALYDKFALPSRLRRLAPSDDPSDASS